MSLGRPPLGDVPLLSRRHYCLFFHLGRTPRPAPRGLRETEALQAQTGGREVHLRCQGGQLPGPPGDRGGPPARSFAPGCDQGYSTPKTATEVRSFLGLAGYYRRYVKGFAAIAAPLHALTRKDALFRWSEDCQAAFDQLKARLTTSPITAFPDFSQEFRLYTDASTAGLGAILAQVREGKERIICCASRALNKAEKSYPATKLECLAIVWAVAKFRPYLMAMPFEVFTDHYALQWLKTMRTGSALLHRWSAALEEYDFTVCHRPGKIQTHVDGLSRLPVGPAPPEDALLHLQVDTEEEARRLVQELHTATHLGGQALWKLFSDLYFHKAGRRICIEVAQSCPQCQRRSDYGHRQKTMGTIEPKGPWDTLSVDIVGPLPVDRRHGVRHRVRGLLF